MAPKAKLTDDDEDDDDPAPADHFNSAFTENRMWCDDCGRWVLARCQRPEYGMIGVMIVAAFALAFSTGGFSSVTIVATIVIGVAILASVANAAGVGPKYLCSRCGQATTRTVSR